MTLLQWLLAPAVLASAALTIALALTGHPFAALWCGVGTYLGARVVRFLGNTAARTAADGEGA